MLRFLKTVLAVIGTVTLLLVAIVAGGVWYATRDRGPDLPDRFALVVDLTQPIREAGEPDPIDRLLGGVQPNLSDILAAIDAAVLDSRVTGLVVRLQGDSVSLPAAQELVAAIDRFTATDRPAIGQAVSIGQLGSANGAYLVATATNPIAVDTMGSVGLTGFNFEIPFAAEALARIGVEAEVVRRGDYKTAFDSVTEDGFTPEHREMMTSLADDLFGQLVGTVADRRALSQSAVRQAINQAPLTAAEALDARLIDRVETDQPGPEQARRLLGAAEDLPLLPVGRYRAALADAQAEAEDRPVFALIEAAGIIVDDGVDGPPGTDGPQITPSALIRVLEQAAEDEDIDGILLTLDSGGGSATASDLIARAIDRVRNEAGKPVVVSMGQVAASGGYWIAAAADRIVAQPATLTGSIGVIAARPNVAQAMSDLGINWDSVQRGSNADLWSPVQPLTARQEDRLEQLIGETYQRFLAHVSEGRDIPVEAVDELGRGRVWTGRQSVDLGLVDRLGGRAAAVEELRGLLGLEAEGGAVLRPIPEPKSPLEQALELADRLPGGLATLSTTDLVDRLFLTQVPGLETTRPFLWALQQGATGQPGAMLVIPPMRLSGY